MKVEVGSDGIPHIIDSNGTCIATIHGEGPGAEHLARLFASSQDLYSSLEGIVPSPEKYGYRAAGVALKNSWREKASELVESLREKEIL